MSKTSTPLLLGRRFGPLCLSGACSAFNDNMVKNAMLVLALFSLGQGWGSGLALMAGALFIAPYVVLGATSGQVADRFSKSRTLIAAKAAEVALMGLATWGLVAHSVPVLLAVVLGLGLQATILSPLKFGLLPELLDDDELLGGNAQVEATTFLAILLGTVVGGAAILLAHGELVVGVTGVVVSVLGLVSACLVPKCLPAALDCRVGTNLVAETLGIVRTAHGVRPVWLCVLGLSWFWFVGSTLMAEFPIIARDVLGANGHVVTLMLCVFAVGVGSGSLACNRMLGSAVSARHVPFAALGIGVFLAGFAFLAAHAGHLPDVGSVLHSPTGLAMLADLGLLAACGGIYSVPLYAIIQERSPAGMCARMVAANNVVNAVVMIAGALATWLLSSQGVGSVGILELVALANLGVTLWIVHILPQDVLRAIFAWYFRCFHRVQVSGLENYALAGSHVVIVSNHQSFLDASLISAYLPQSPTFAVHSATATKWWVRPFLAAVDVFKVDLQSSYAVKHMVEAVRDGRKLMIFPEGRLTKTGNLMKIYEGAGLVATKTESMVLPVCIEGLQYTHLGRMGGKLPISWFPRLKLSVMAPVDLTPPGAAAMSPRQRREAVGRGLQDLLVNTVFQAKNIDRSMFTCLLDARATFGGRADILEDVERKPLTYTGLVQRSVGLGRKLLPLIDANLVPEDYQRESLARGLSMQGDDGADSRLGLQADVVPMEALNVGIMLPNVASFLVAFMGLQAFARVVFPLNYSAGEAGMMSICRAGRVRTVVSSRAFVEKAKLGRVVEAMESSVRFVWLEDVKASITRSDRVRAVVDALNARNLPGALVDPGKPAVVLSTSGSEGAPKGVVHSHRSLAANCAQLSSIIDFTAADRVFNAMPMFHSFGLTGATLLPLFHGVRVFLYPSPLHYRIVPSMIYDTDATIIFGTDTFYRNWARYAHQYDFYAVRYAFAGAEKVQASTKTMYAERFRVCILEGYGTTETAPALTMNTAMNSRAGTVGRFLPGIQTRLDPVPGIAQGGRLFVRGPNVMLGYYKADNPGVLVPVADGWYDTGDIFDIDPEGFGIVLGRAKRIAKIAGEMVSMMAAEELVAAVWTGGASIVVNIADARKGEVLVAMTTQPDAASGPVLAYARAHGVAEIMVPRIVMPVDAIPLLGTGKTDYPSAQRMVEQWRTSQVNARTPDDAELVEQAVEDTEPSA